jgi:hypothetical protein
LADATPTGRAEVVLSLIDGRAATKAVARGGVVCLPDRQLPMPTVTEVVQRELRLVGVHSLRDLLSPQRAGALVPLLAEVSGGNSRG